MLLLTMHSTNSNSWEIMAGKERSSASSSTWKHACAHYSLTWAAAGIEIDACLIGYSKELPVAWSCQSMRAWISPAEVKINGSQEASSHFCSLLCSSTLRNEHCQMHHLSIVDVLIPPNNAADVQGQAASEERPGSLQDGRQVVLRGLAPIEHQRHHQPQGLQLHSPAPGILYARHTILSVPNPLEHANVWGNSCKLFAHRIYAWELDPGAKSACMAVQKVL